MNDLGLKQAQFDDLDYIIWKIKALRYKKRCPQCCSREEQELFIMNIGVPWACLDEIVITCCKECRQKVENSLVKSKNLDWRSNHSAPN